MSEFDEINPFSAPQEFKSEPVPRSAAARGPKGIGGWLILVAIGLFISPFRIGALMLTTHVPLFVSGQFSQLIDRTSANYNPLLGPLLLMEVIGNLIIAGMAVAGLVLMFLKSPRFPKWMIGFYAANLAFLVIDAFMVTLIPNVEQDIETIGGIAGAAVACAIWIPYMCVSVRVKNTFVR